jgi:hypothetical protein
MDRGSPGIDAQGRALLPFGGVGRQHRYYVVNAARDAAAEIADLEARCDGAPEPVVGFPPE